MLQLFPGLASCLRELGDELTVQDDFDASTIEASALTGKNILLVDDDLRNRQVGIAQFGNGNDLTVTASYEEALKLLSNPHRFDIVFADLMMPVEGFMLGKTREAQIGLPIAAGHYVVNRAIGAGVPYIHVVSAGSHHDNPDLAALDYACDLVFPKTTVRYTKHPKFVQGGKDWSAAYHDAAR
jgi:CheY-like chemotaxis protein